MHHLTSRFVLHLEFEAAEFKLIPSELSPIFCPNRFLNILLVDDDNFTLELIADILRDLGASKITTAANGKQAISRHTTMEAPPDIVICDLNMPEKDGFQLMQMLAEKKSLASIILMTGLDDRVLNSAALMGNFHNLHVLSTLKKPVERNALEQLLKQQGSISDAIRI